MNKNILKVIPAVCLALMAFTTNSQTTTSGNYKLVWEDNFDDAKLNSKIWNAEKNKKGGGNAEFQYYKPENIYVARKNGTSCLVLSAKNEIHKGRPATSGRINSQGKLSVKYAKIEARVFLPKTANGLWPAFWLMGDDKDQVGWPKCGEIDVIEMGNATGIEKGIQDKFYNGACHWGEAFNNGRYPNLVQTATSETSLQNDFHLFTLIWTPDSLKMFLDLDKNPERKPYFVMSIKGDYEPGSPSRYFHKPFHLIANLAVGGYFTGLPSPSKKAIYVSSKNKKFQKVTALPADGTPVEYFIDYIRIYQNGTQGEELNIKE